MHFSDSHSSILVGIRGQVFLTTVARCKHKSHSSQTHILSSFTRQFSNTENASHTVEVPNDDEWSASSDIDHTDDSSDNDESVDDFSRQSGSAFQLVDRPQHSLERVPDAFQAAVEDPMQPCSPMSAAAIDRRTEFFVLSPS